MDIYVSNLSPFIVNEDLNNHFSRYGVVSSANVIIDKFTNRSRGFGFVTMPNDTEAEKAIQEMNGSLIDGKTIAASQARPREEKPGRSYNNRW
ncbi:RNA recognition motif domain-containing protein [Chitinophaga pinensis]|uniref:RNP-1 like RNA-binding protein n=1 Tax=Chitinophaga pinensis (strain ATCC 43595 / DSM 2588 / LMG 13176 / NBRC 15968 / NCIMB 11800 / UQM 2034) TaxID=485918 RepID=A0A979GY99_CHIPD|nr:RNA-binding protein [Chitinophaga pinensis]ACU61790.1 RNP-1 like RNA-binding protein [Chitinophaga pinensis DSM 2588]